MRAGLAPTARLGLSMENGIRERLFPNEAKFFVAFSQIAERLTGAATLLAEAFDDPARFPELAATIHKVDREADEASHAVDLRLERMLVPPIDQEDIHLLSTRLRRVVDIVGGTARRAVSMGAIERREPAAQLARVLVRATQEIEAAMLHLRDGRGVLGHCQAIKRAEEEGDAIWEKAVSALFAGTPDPLTVLRWKTLYDQLEDALDACEDVANELETISVKHA